MLDLVEHPEATAGFRFMIASLAQAMAILTVHYALRHEPRYPGHSLVLYGWAIEAQSWAIHQYYYFIWWAIKGQSDSSVMFWEGLRFFTTLSLIAGAFGWILVASPYLKFLVGRFWLALGIALSVTLWTVGYGLIKWL